MTNQIAAVQTHPKYQDLVSRRTRFGWIMTAIMLMVCFSYVLLIAFNKKLLAQSISDDVTSIGIPLGFGIIGIGPVSIMPGRPVPGQRSSRPYLRDGSSLFADAGAQQ